MITLAIELFGLQLCSLEGGWKQKTLRLIRSEYCTLSSTPVWNPARSLFRLALLFSFWTAQTICVYFPSQSTNNRLWKGEKLLHNSIWRQRKEEWDVNNHKLLTITPNSSFILELSRFSFYNETEIWIQQCIHSLWAGRRFTSFLVKWIQMSWPEEKKKQMTEWNTQYDKFFNWFVFELVRPVFVLNMFFFCSHYQFMCI